MKARELAEKLMQNPDLAVVLWDCKGGVSYVGEIEVQEELGQILLNPEDE